MGGIKARNGGDIWFTAKMIGLIKLFVFSCAAPLVLGITSVRDDANWFKNGQRIKNRFVTGVVNGIVDYDCTDTVNGEPVEGECLSKVECSKSGGKVGGLCSLLGSCCVLEKTCSQTTSSKVSYFVPPGKFQSECVLTVKIYSKDVRQLRLDFEKFDIAKPKSDNIVPENEIMGYTSYQCQDDAFTVETGNVNLGFQHLCGRNRGQHIYVPVAENQQKVLLTFTLKNRTGSDANLGQADWRIKIRQLELPKAGYEHFLNAPSKLMTMYNNLKNKKHSKSDLEIIAPANCLQYYPNRTGTFESFNYDEGRGNYIGNMNYAICFSQAPGVCGARYTSEGIFQMNYNEVNTEVDDRCHPQKPASSTVSQDFIRIPNAADSLNLYRDNYCNADLQSKSVVAKSYEPLYVGVHTDGYRVSSSTEEEKKKHLEIGFRLRYELNSGKCDIPF